MNLKSDMVDAVSTEIVSRKNFLKDDRLSSIYFGGGTPSVLNHAELSKILETIYAQFNLEDNIEITLEANPDDLSKEYIKVLKETGVNRLSIGIQSFFEEDLLWMNRSHTVEQAFDSIEHARNLGIDNITIDLIFGSPSSSRKKWQQNLQKAVDLDIPHISSYGLTVEPKTALEHMVRTGKVKAPSDEDYAEQFEYTISFLESHGYVHYEISNYAKEGFFAVHNSNYWKAVPYLGVGPSAHSFNGSERSWNVSHNKKYLDSLAQGQLLQEVETLSSSEQYNEYILTGMRTMWGCSTDRIAVFGQLYADHFRHTAQKHIEGGYILQNAENYKLSSQGKLIANEIISDLFYIDQENGGE